MSSKEPVLKWKMEKLSVLADYISRGITPKYTEDFKKSILVVNQRCIRDGKVLFEDARRHDIDKKNVNEEKYLKDLDVLINSTGVGTLGRVSQIKEVYEPTTADSHVTIVRGNIGYIDRKYLGYAIKAQQLIIENMAEGSTGQTELSRKRLGEEIVVGFPKDKQEQKAIAYILSALDDKIEVNNQINKTLENMSQTIFKQWFVDFEFPNEDGEPYQSSGGEMIESELGMIPKGWKVMELGEFFPVITGKKNANISSDTGEYPFFSCSQDIAWTNDYSFDGSAILVAGNGDFNVKWYIGKFEAYQRTYVLIPYNKILTGMLYYAIKFSLDKITSGHRGSVIKFITKGSIENFKIVMPLNVENFEIISTFESLNSMIQFNNYQIRALRDIRDSLLPKLMSGEIRVPLDDKDEASENPNF